MRLTRFYHLSISIPSENTENQRSGFLIFLGLEKKVSGTKRVSSWGQLLVEVLSEHIRPETVTRRCSVKKVPLKITQNSQENISVRVSFLIRLQVKACNFIKKETLTQVFSCEFGEIFKNTFFIEYLWWLLLYDTLSISFFIPSVKVNHLSANPTKWSNTLKQFVGKFPTNFLSVFDHFVGLALIGLMIIPTKSSAAKY